MKKEDTEFVLTEETREIVAAYLARKQKPKKSSKKDSEEVETAGSKTTKK